MVDSSAVYVQMELLYFLCFFMSLSTYRMRTLPWILYFQRDIGIILLFAVMATAFIGYVLVWGQISFWGATVITNLLSTIPYMGTDLLEWIWGGFSLDKATLTWFFTFHFLLPFIISTTVIVHLLFLHEVESNNPTGIPCYIDIISFYPYYTIKDILGFLLIC